MARRRKGDPIHGWLVFDKPQGMTSTQAVSKVRYLYGAQKAGHAGTLDPLATGVLPIAFGEATKTVPFAVDGDKQYRFTVCFGTATDTLLVGTFVDGDTDGIPNVYDNCLNVVNPDQRDTDFDGFGNICDGDLNNSLGIVNFADLSVFRAAFGTTNPHADFNGNGGLVNFADLATFRALAEHLTNEGAVFYGAEWCSHCQEQKRLFGASASRLPYIECSPSGRNAPQSSTCRRASSSARRSIRTIVRCASSR